MIANGGRGGSGSNSTGTFTVNGGVGELVETNLGLLPNQTLYVTAGPAGASASSRFGAPGAGNGGGNGGTGASGANGVGGGAGGGGGASDIRTVSGSDQASLNSRLVVAPGGGGGGGNGSSGGPGGSPGGNGTAGGGCSATPSGGGQAGTDSAGGAGGTGGGGAGAGGTGLFGVGGGGADGISSFGGNGGGGGGGGWWGGGGGGGTSFTCAGAGGGGGGSPYTDPAKTSNTSFANGGATSLVELDYMPANGGGSVVISQVYGGGGTQGGTYANDWIELFNRSASPVDVSGWSVQYTSSAGTTWQATSIPNGTTMSVGSYLLIQEGGGGTGDVLLDPDVTGAIFMGQNSGKVALVQSPGTALSGRCPNRTDAVRGNIADFVGYGYQFVAPLTCFEGSGGTPTTGQTTSVKRAGQGCLDSDDNTADFPAAGEPDPRNSQAPVANCFAPANVLAPTMTGTPAVGSTLSCSPGTWQSNPAPDLSYRFVRSLGGGGFSPIPGGDGAQYVVTNEDVGSRVACEEIATNPSTGYSAAARSNSKTAAAGVPVNTDPPAITGDAIVGNTLNCTKGTWDNGPLGYSRMWLRNGAETGETAVQHFVTQDDRGTRLSCRVIANNDVGNSVPATSAAAFAVAGRPSNTSRPTLTLTSTGPRPTDKDAVCSTGSWADDPGGPYDYVIQHAGADVVGTSSTYHVAVTDLGRELTCTVTAHNVAGTGSATSDPVLVPLPPPDASAGPTHMYKAGGNNEFDPVNLLATSDGLQRDLQAAQQARVQAAYTAFLTKCGTKTLDAGLPTTDPRTITDTAKRETELCRLLLNTPADQITIGFDGVRIVSDPSKCVLGTNDPCAVLPVPMPAANDIIASPAIDVNTVPERVIWDFNSDGRLDADCPGSAPVARSIFRPGNYNVRAILVMPGSEETGQYPSATLTLSHFASSSPPSRLTMPYSPGGVSSRTAAGFARAASVTTTLQQGLTSTTLQLGSTRKAQPFTCRTALQPPPEPTQPCASDGYMGKVHVEGNLCPISLRSVPQDEINALKNSDPDIYQVLLAENEARGAAARRRAPPAAQPAVTFGDNPVSANSIAMQQFASPIPERFDFSKNVRDALRNANIGALLQAPLVLDQITIARGPLKINGVDIKPRSGAVLFVPSDTGEAIKSVTRMVVSASDARSSLGGIPLDAASGPLKQSVNDAQNAADQVFKQLDLDAIARQLKAKLPDLGPFRLAGDATVKLVDGAAVLDAYAELPALLTAPGSSPIRVQVTIRARPDGTVKLDGVRLHAGQAYLGAVRLQDIDLLYDGGLTVSGKILFPSNAGVDIQEFRIDSAGRFRSLVLAYLAGAGQGIPVGPGVFLTKIGGGLSLDPDEIRASAAVSVGPSATGGGCPTVGGDGQLVLHFGPAPLFVKANMDMQIVCLGLTQVDFFARQDGYVTLGAHMGFDGGPLYFGADIRGSMLLPNWQVEGSGEGGIRHVLSGSVNVLISNRGFAGCGSVDLGFLGDISGGAGVRYNPTLLLGPQAILANLKLFTGCDLSAWRTVVAAPARAAATPGSRALTVARGDRALVVAVDGDTAAPRVTLRGPDGTVVDLAGDADEAHIRNGLGTRSEDEKRTFFLVGKPAAGRWTIEPAEGSARVVRVQRSGVLPKPKLSVRVRGTGARRVVSWNVARRAGQVVRLVEQANGGGQPLATIKGGGRGSKRFVVVPAGGTKRTIVAHVEQDGLPRDNVTVATFSAPSPRVGRAAHVKVRRKGKSAVITWTPAFYAARYDVIVTRTSGGRAVLSPLGKKRQVAVGALGRDGLAVKVVGISASGQRGPATKAKLAAKHKPKRHAKRR